MATTFSPYIQNELDQTNNFGFGEFNYQPLKTFSEGEKYLGEYGQAANIGLQYPGSSMPGIYNKQGLSSDVRHTLGASAGKDMLIDWASQFGIDKTGGLANLIGNTGIVASTALQEIPDAWNLGKQTMRKGDYGSLLKGEFLTQPWEDVLANLQATNIPYGTDVSDKMDYIPGIKKWMMNKRATQQGLAQIAAQQQIQQAEAAAKQERDRQVSLQAQVTSQANREARERVGRGEARDYGHTQTRSSSGWRSDPMWKGGIVDLYKYGGFI